MVFRLRFCVALVIAAVLPLAAQVTTAELAGTVADPTGAVIGNAKVVATSTETGLAHAAVTDGSGNYLLTFLPPGGYNLSAEAAGFRRVMQNNVTLEIAQRARVDFKMEVGEVTETVQVTAAAPLLESQSSSLGSVVEQTLVQDMPLNNRNFVQLATMVPGVNGTGYSTPGTIMSGSRPDDRRPGSEIFSNGNREGDNNFLYDGIDDNDRLTLSIVLRPPVEAVREFKVQTNLFSADVGRSSGAIVDVVTKSGANTPHGSAFEFLQNSAMDARSFFNKAGTPFPPFRYNQFGFSLGGPVYIPHLYNGKNRTFFFVDYEGYRRGSLSTSVITLPTAAMRAGNFAGINTIFDPLTTTPSGNTYTRTQFPNNQIPLSRFDPVTVKMVNAYPLPTGSGITNNYTESLLQTQSWNQGDVRVDEQISASNTFFARWSIQHTATVVPNSYPAVQLAGLPKPVTVGDEASFAGTSFTPDQHAVADYVHVFSPHLVNDLRVGFSRFVVNYTAEGATQGLNQGNLLGVPNSNTNSFQNMLPIFSPAGFLGIGDSRSVPIYRRMNTFQYIDGMTWTHGDHTIKFGGDVTRRQITEYQTNQGNGRFNFSTGFTAAPGVSGSGNSMASMDLGYPTLIEQDLMLIWPGIRGVENGLYIADDWRATKKLTLNLGLRWEYMSPYTELHDYWANFNLATGVVDMAGQKGVSATAGVPKTWTNFDPRFGFAYQVDAHTVLRGGIGIFSDPNGSGATLMRLNRQAPFGPIYNVSPGDEFVATRASDGFPAPPPVVAAPITSPNGNAIGVSRDFKTAATVYQFNLTLEREIPGHVLLKAAYLGNLGRNLGASYNPNQPVPGSGATLPRRPYYSIDPTLADVNWISSDGLSNYNAFQFTAERRLSQGLSMLLAYTWGHGIDNTGTEFSGGYAPPQDPRCRNCDRSNSNSDIRQRLTATYTYMLPWGKGRAFLNRGGVTNVVLGGWQTNGFVTAQTGVPFTPTLQTTTVNTGTGSRPNCVGTGKLASGQNINDWFDVTSFVAPPLYTFGNCGRNILFGPGRVNLDLSLFKDFPFRENLKLQFRAEAFNSLNSPQFSLPSGSIGNPAAAVISAIVGNPRLMQLSLRIQF